MPTVELDIRQLADEGGTAPLAPITVTDAVLDENGDTLTDTLDTLKNGLANLNSKLNNGAELLGATSGTGAKTLTDSYKKYRYIILVGFIGSKIFPVMIHSLFLLSAGYTLSVSGGGSDIFSVTFTGNTTVNIISNPNQIRIYGIEKM